MTSERRFDERSERRKVEVEIDITETRYLISVTDR